MHLGSFNAPTNVNTGACVAHVFWQAPDENRLTQADYRTGAFVVDFEDLASPAMLGWFLPDGGAMYWANKPHNGYLYATDMDHGLDILRYTGEGGNRWPATVGAAEIQRLARQGVPYVPIRSGRADAASTDGPQGAAATPETAPALAPATPARTASREREREVRGSGCGWSSRVSPGAREPGRVSQSRSPTVAERSSSA